MKNKLSKKDIDEMIYEAIKDETDLIDYTGKVRSLYLLVYNSYYILVAFCEVLCENETSADLLEKKKTVTTISNLAPLSAESEDLL